jgi:hypothetical protein
VFRLWHCVVVASSAAINFDFFALRDTEAIDRPFITGKASLGSAFSLPNISNPGDVIRYQAYLDFLSDYVPPGEDPGEPKSNLYYPIFDAIDGIRANGTDQQVVGLLWLGFFWRDALKDLLPGGSVGIDVVVSNPCTTAFTYRLDGQKSTFVGAGDLHEGPYSQYGVNSTLLGLRKFAVSKSSYTGVPVDEEYCPILLTVYPSSATQSQYTTTNRIIFTVCSVLIFVFTSIVFILYDKSVERRQTKVMKSAVRAETIVQSLFPAVVRDRIYPTEADTGGGNNKNPKSAFKVANSKARIQTFLGSSSRDDTDATDAGGDTFNSPPVADLFPECTVMFTDIVGTCSTGSVHIPGCSFLVGTLLTHFIARYQCLRVHVVVERP